MISAWDEPKDPNEILDYDMDWQPAAPSAGKVPRLDDGDTIATSAWSVVAAVGGSAPDPDDLILDDATKTDTKTKVWLSGGVDGVTYTLLNRVTTVGGRTMDQSAKLKVKSK